VQTVGRGNKVIFSGFAVEGSGTALNFGTDQFFIKKPLPESPAGAGNLI